ncbi:MAG: hypothetical protein GF353_15525 [Candidatus Lokiarchaeota archaeon]|nr:hypothetical protein [Candidatus Lokiarchaeota archaeon]
MTITTISIKEDTKRELKRLKQHYKLKSMDELLKKLIVEAKKRFIDDFSKDFRQRLEEKGLTLGDIIKSGLEIRKEILKERGLM